MNTKMKTRLLSLLLCCVMLIGLLPTVALAAQTTGVVIKSPDGSSQVALNSSNGCFLVNGAAANSGTLGEGGCTAQFDTNTGTLTLQGFNGGSIYATDPTNNDLIVKLVGTNTITNTGMQAALSSTNGTITITSESAGSLTINSSATSGSVSGISTGYSAGQVKGSVIFSGSANVTINVTNNSSGVSDKAYGVFAMDAIKVLDAASISVVPVSACNSPDCALGLYINTGATSSEGIIINTTGDVTIDTSTTTGQRSYPVNNARNGATTLTKVGTMTLKYKKDGTYSKDAQPAWTYTESNFAKRTGDSTGITTTVYKYGTPHTVTVTNGKYDNGNEVNASETQYIEGEVATITAPALASNLAFKNWTSASSLNYAETTSATSNPAKITVGNADISVKANYTAFSTQPTFALTGEYADGGNQYPKGKISWTLAGGTPSYTYLVPSTGYVYGYGGDQCEVVYNSLTSSTEFCESISYSPVVKLDAGTYRIAVEIDQIWFYSQTFTVSYANSDPSAAVSDVTISGTKGNAISNTVVTVTLTNDTFESSLSGNWITNLPAGLTQSVARTSDTTATITVSGTPTATSTAQMAITIPAAQLVTSDSNLTVTANANAKYNIAAPTWTVAITGGAGMSTTGNVNQTVEQGSGITSVVYTAADGYYFPADYSVAAQNGISVTRDSYTQITVSGTPTAAVNLTLTNATAKTKETTPSAEFTAESENGGKLTGVDNTMKYSVDGGSNWLDITGDNMAITNVTTANGVQVKKPASDANTKLDSDPKLISVTKATAPTTATGVACTTNSNNDGKLQNVTNLMEYKKSDAGSWTDCGGTEVSGLVNGTYYVRVKATGTILASDYQEVQIAAYGVAALAGTVSIDGAAKFGSLLTANTSGITNNTGTLSYQWKRGSTNIGTNSATYTIGEDDIGSTITVTVTSSVETGEITSAATATIEKADGPAAPTGLAGVAPTTNGGSGGKITGTATTMEYSTDSSFTNPTGTVCQDTETTGFTAGTYYVRIKETTTHKAGAYATVTVPAYSISLDTTGTHTFTAATVGYAAQTAKTVTVSNTGNSATGPLTVALSGTDAASFELNKTSIGDIAVSGSDTFTVVPKTGLSAGTYTATVTVSGDNSINASFNVSFTVNAADPTYSIALSPSGTQTFTAATVGYGAQTAKTITVSNTGTGATGALTVALSGSNANSFELNKTSIADIAVGNSDTFTIVPKTGLSAGTYTATVSVSGGNSITASFNVSFTVNPAGGGGGGGGYTPATYSLTVDKTENGSISISPKNAAKGDTVTVTVKPDEGYELDTLKVVDKNGNKVAVSEKNGKYTFTMPASKVTVTAIFTEFEQPVVNPFTDVKESDYYYEAVQWALKNGITDGTSASTFSPNANCTRAQIVTFLWRATGSPAPKNSENTFTDLKADAYYHDAVLWAAEQGITSGTGGGKFSPEAVCTRSQSVTLLYHAAGSPKVSGNASFSDVEPNAYYAAAVAWAEQNGVTGGIGGGLFGSANDCTRGQIVTFLYRFFVK